MMAMVPQGLRRTGGTGGGEREKFIAAGEEAIDTVCPVVGAGSGRGSSLRVFPARACRRRIRRARTVEEGGKLTVIHAQKQDDAVTVRTFAEFIGVIDLPGSFIGAVVVVFVIVNGDDVNADAIVLRDGFGIGLNSMFCDSVQDACVVGDVPELAFGKDGHAQAQHKRQHKRKPDDSFFMARPSLTSKNRYTAESTAVSPAAMAAKVPPELAVAGRKVADELAGLPVHGKEVILAIPFGMERQTGSSA